MLQINLTFKVFHEISYGGNIVKTIFIFKIWQACH